MKTYSNFIYNTERAFIFAYIPKVACTNWKSALRYMAGHDDYLNNRLAHDKIHGGLRYLDLQGADASLLSDPGIRKYTFVRDPYSRALSSYLNKIESRLNWIELDQSDRWTRVAKSIDRFQPETLGPNGNAEINFEKFLFWLRDSSSHFCSDEHWQLQSILLRWPDVKFDFIGRFENIDMDAQHLLSEMGCDIPFPSRADVKFPASGAALKISQFLTPTCCNLIEQVFAADFENLGYNRLLCS